MMIDLDSIKRRELLALNVIAKRKANSDLADEAFNAMPKPLVSDEILELAAYGPIDQGLMTEMAQELLQWRKWAKEQRP